MRLHQSEVVHALLSGAAAGGTTPREAAVAIAEANGEAADAGHAGTGSHSGLRSPSGFGSPGFG